MTLEEHRKLLQRQLEELRRQPVPWVRCSCGTRLRLQDAFKCRECLCFFCSACSLDHFGMEEDPQTGEIGSRVVG